MDSRNDIDVGPLGFIIPKRPDIGKDENVALGIARYFGTSMEAKHKRGFWVKYREVGDRGTKQ